MLGIKLRAKYKLCNCPITWVHPQPKVKPSPLFCHFNNIGQKLRCLNILYEVIKHYCIRVYFKVMWLTVSVIRFYHSAFRIKQKKKPHLKKYMFSQVITLSFPPYQSYFIKKWWGKTSGSLSYIYYHRYHVQKRNFMSTVLILLESSQEDASLLNSNSIIFASEIGEGLSRALHNSSE